MIGAVFQGAAYGKPTGASPADGDQYCLLFRSAGFSDAAVEALTQLAGSVQWKGQSSDRQLAPLYVLWPVGSEDRGVLAARLLDTGRDALGRAPTLRVEAVFFPSADSQSSADIAAKYLSPSGWPAAPWSGSDGIDMATDPMANEQLSNEVAELISKLGRIPRFLVSNHHYFFAQGFDAIHGPDGSPSDALRQRSHEFGPRPLSEPARMSDASAAPAKGRPLALAVVCLLFAGIGLLAGGVGGVAFERSVSRPKLQEADRMLETKNRELARTKGDLEDCESRLAAADNAAKQLDQLRAKEKDFEEYRQVLKEHGIIGPGELRARLGETDSNFRGGEAQRDGF